MLALSTHGLWKGICRYPLATVWSLTMRLTTRDYDTPVDRIYCPDTETFSDHGVKRLLNNKLQVSRAHLLCCTKGRRIVGMCF